MTHNITTMTCSHISTTLHISTTIHYHEKNKKITSNNYTTMDHDENTQIRGAQGGKEFLYHTIIVSYKFLKPRTANSLG